MSRAELIANWVLAGSGVISALEIGASVCSAAVTTTVAATSGQTRDAVAPMAFKYLRMTTRSGN
jgi:hypothetical protein